MHPQLLQYFFDYPSDVAPFMHQQLVEWEKTRPLTGLKVVHHVPVVANTVLKIACLIAAGADVTVTNPSSFMAADFDAVRSLHAAGVRYVDDYKRLTGEAFDLYFDCGAELFQSLGRPGIGAIELTGSGDALYRRQSLDFPVVSIDQTLTKQLETVFGCAESVNSAIAQETEINPVQQSWLIFGFGKIGRGLAYFCMNHHTPIVVVEVSETQRTLANKLGIKTIDPGNQYELKEALSEADIIITATGEKALLSNYPYEWFAGKNLVNMGVYDEYGDQFGENEVLNNKKPVNFILKDPTPMKYIDPEFYLHNITALMFHRKKLLPYVHGVPSEVDKEIIRRWCDYHSFPLEVITRWFISEKEFTEMNRA